MKSYTDLEQSKKFVPCDLDTENLNTIGNYQPKELFGKIKVFAVPPYSLLVDKNKINEINLDPPSDNKLFWMDFDIKEK